MNSINEDPQSPGISGKTVDGGREIIERMPSHVEPGQGVTRFISKNYAAWGRAAYPGSPIASRNRAFSEKNAVRVHSPY